MEVQKGYEQIFQVHKRRRSRRINFLLLRVSLEIKL